MKRYEETLKLFEEALKLDCKDNEPAVAPKK